MANFDPKGELLKRRSAAGGWLSVGGFAFSLASLRVDPSLESPALLGFYAMAAGVAACVTYQIRHILHGSALRRKRRQADAERIFLGGGIR